MNDSDVMVPFKTVMINWFIEGLNLMCRSPVVIVHETSAVWGVCPRAVM